MTKNGFRLVSAGFAESGVYGVSEIVADLSLFAHHVANTDPQESATQRQLEHRQPTAKNRLLGSNSV